MNLTPKNLWIQYLKTIESKKSEKLPEVFHFCDNQTDADQLANLVVKGIKTATCSSLIGYKKKQEALPFVGEQAIVADWAGNAKAVIETTQVNLVPFDEVTDDFAFLEGEGDRSLAYWRKEHKAFFEREAIKHGYLFSGNMMLVCEQFETMFTINDISESLFFNLQPKK